MIRRGKKEGWLTLPLESLQSFASLYGIDFRGVRVASTAGRGSALVASRTAPRNESEPFLVVPKDIILTRGHVFAHSASDKHLREVLEAVGDFGKVFLSLRVPCRWRTYGHSPQELPS